MNFIRSTKYFAKRNMHEERKYSFQDHVFFDQYLTKFPEKGPIRKFMELVTLGLSMNPYITVPEKHEHIQWFAEYFGQKQEVLVGVLGDDGKMKTENVTGSNTKKISGKKKAEQRK
ncbi:28S ribosomal protein S31, mitochondrial [Bulinus truncatus]|nr:28S ribosomal protein S31, mitochondrial [Bulinus truncatus]